MFHFHDDTDTRPFIQGKTAILRTMLILKRSLQRPESDPPTILSPSRPPLTCLWVDGVGGGQLEAGHGSSPLSAVPYGDIRQSANKEYLGSCQTNVSEATLRARGSVPRFVTIVSSSDGLQGADHVAAGSWVHVTVIPLVVGDAQEVHKHYSWGSRGGGGAASSSVGHGGLGGGGDGGRNGANSTSQGHISDNSRGYGGYGASTGVNGGHNTGPFLTPQMHEAGDGAIATCTSTPLMGNDRYATSLPQWLAFQKVLGVSKVFAYLLDPGPNELQILRHYERAGLVEIWSFRFSRFLAKRQHLGDKERCHVGGSYHQVSARGLSTGTVLAHMTASNHQNDNRPYQ